MRFRSAFLAAPLLAAALAGCSGDTTPAATSVAAPTEVAIPPTPAQQTARDDALAFAEAAREQAGSDFAFPDKMDAEYLKKIEFTASEGSVLDWYFVTGQSGDTPLSFSVCISNDDAWAVYDSAADDITAEGSQFGCPELPGDPHA